MRPRAGGLESAWAGGLEEPEQQLRRPRREPAWAGPGRRPLPRIRSALHSYFTIILHYFSYAK